MSLPTPRQSISQKQFHQCVNQKKKQSLRHPLPTFATALGQNRILDVQGEGVMQPESHHPTTSGAPSGQESSSKLTRSILFCSAIDPSRKPDVVTSIYMNFSTFA